MVCRPMKQWICITFCIFSCLYVSNGYAHDQSGEALFDLGVFAFEDKDYKAAQKFLLQAHQLNPENPFYCHFLGKIYLALDQLDSADIYLQKAYQLNPVINELEYDLAYLTFKRADFQNASHQFMQIVEKDPFTQNVLACYYAGISLFQCKKYPKAINYLMRASRRSPTMKPNCMFYCGICYYKMNNTIEALRHFEYVLIYASEPLKSHAKNWLIALRDTSHDKKKFEALIKLSFFYDDNVMIVTPDLITGDEADSAMLYYISGKYHWQWLPKHQIAFGIRHYQTFHKDLSEFDLTGSVVDLSYYYKLNDYTCKINYSPSAYWLERYRYMFRHRMKASVQWKIMKDLTNHVAYTCDILDNYNNELRDGHTHEFSMFLSYRIPSYSLLLLAGVSAQDNLRKHVLYQYSEMIYNLEFIYKIVKNWKWHTYVRLYQRRFDIWEDVKRKDDKINFLSSLSHPFWKDGLELTIDYDYSKNNSKLDQFDFFDYRRNTFGISLIYYY